MTRQQRKVIEREFYRYEANRDKAASYLSDHAYDDFGVNYTEPRVVTSRRNGVELRIVSMISEAERAYKWSMVFQKTLERFRWTHKDNLMLRRYITREIDTQTCMEICIERRTYYYWLDEILKFAFMWAREYKLL